MGGSPEDIQMNDLTDENIDFWIKNNLNVIVKGKHGTGKTSRIMEGFKRHGLKAKYFSCSTMDVYTDFIGIPKERVDPNTGNSYLDLVRPKEFADDDVECIFMDEYNRCPSPKVQNATMELIQFKSINGHKFKNLRFVWAAVNPGGEGSEYAVNDLDPAHLDRFHVHIDVPYAPDAAYFTKKFGEEKAEIAIRWWKKLDEKFQNLLSPRRLDIALDMYMINGDVSHVVDHRIDVSSLIQELSVGSNMTRLNDLIRSKDELGLSKAFNEEDFASSVQDAVVNNNELRVHCLKHFSQERLMSSMSAHKHIAKHVLSSPKLYTRQIWNLAQSGIDNDICRAAKKTVLTYPDLFKGESFNTFGDLLSK